MKKIIRYKKKRLLFNFIFGVIWLIFGLMGIFTKEKPFWTDYGFVIISLVYLMIFYYEKKNNYLTIENGIIFKNNLTKKKIELKNISQIKKFAGDITLITNDSELKINTEIIDENSLIDLNNVLNDLKLKQN